MSSRKVLYALAMSVLVFSLTPIVAHAQESTRPIHIDGFTPFAVVAMDSMPYPDADAVILRRRGGILNDVIMVRAEKLTPNLLAASVRTLGGLRALYGNIPDSDGTYRVRHDSRQWKRPGEPENWIASLRTVRPATLRGVGHVRHLVLYMPDQRRAR